MNRQEPPPATKRKGSPSQAPDDVSPKRTRMNGPHVDPLRESSNENGTAGLAHPRPASVGKSEHEARDEESRESSFITEKPAKTPDAPVSLPAPEKKVKGKNATAKWTQGAQEPGRGNLSQEEKKRGQRLFGGLLSTLSQTAPRSQQKKRLETERRQHVKAEQQRSEDDKRREERLAKLRRRRKVEQAKLDEEVMNLRHSNLLAMAHSLYTKAEPRLYYLPYELTAQQEATIKRQVQDAEAIIEKETMELKRSKERRSGSHAAPRPLAVNASASLVGNTFPTRDANLLPRSKTSSEKDNDEGGDEMVQDTEDTVLY